VSAVDTTTTTVAGITIDGVPGIYVEDSYGCSWEHPDEISEQGWASVTYSAQAVASDLHPYGSPMVEVSGYAPRATVVGLARNVAELRRNIHTQGDEIRVLGDQLTATVAALRDVRAVAEALREELTAMVDQRERDLRVKYGLAGQS
jgi:hypothetical protein